MNPSSLVSYPRMGETHFPLTGRNNRPGEEGEGREWKRGRGKGIIERKGKGNNKMERERRGGEERKRDN